MRPSSGGSSLMSNWLEPACARDAMAIGRPAIETAAAGVEDAAAVVWVVAEFVVRMPKAGKLAVTAFIVLVAVCALDEAPSDAGVSTCAVMRLAAGAAAASAGVMTDAAACWGLASPDAGVLAVGSAAAAGFPAAASAARAWLPAWPFGRSAWVVWDVSPVLPARVIWPSRCDTVARARACAVDCCGCR